jgi:hypothetical protein
VDSTAGAGWVIKHVSELVSAKICDLYLCFSLTNVRLDSATQDGPGEEANNVEQCYCPPSYTGTSCEVGTGVYIQHFK